MRLSTNFPSIRIDLSTGRPHGAPPPGVSTRRPQQGRSVAVRIRPGAETRVPMALTVIGGVTVSTFLTLFEKTYHSSLKNSGIKIYKASALGGRAFAVSEAKQEELLTKSVETYRDAMQRAGIQHL